DQGRCFALQPALDRVAEMVADGADVIDIGGVKAGLGPEVSPAQEIARIEALVGRVREKHPDVAISIDTWRAEVARAVLPAGADPVDDAWGGHDPQLAEVAAEVGASLVCPPRGGR